MIGLRFFFCMSVNLLQKIYLHSFRWLVTQKRVKEAEVVLKKAAKVNKRTFRELFIEETKEEKSKATFLDLFKTSNLRKNTLIQYFNWFTASFVYYALTFDSGMIF